MQIPGAAPVVVGVNGTAAGLAAVRLAAREAVARGRELRVVHAFTWPSHRYGPTDQEYAPARHAAGRIVEQAITIARRSSPPVRVSGYLIDGLPVRVLLQQSHTAELLLLGDDDVASVPRLPLDSVLLQIVSRAWCPVVVARGVRPPSGPLLAAVDGSAASLLALRHAAGEARRRGLPVEVVHVIERPGAEAEAAGRRLVAASLAAVPDLTGARVRLMTGDPARALVRASRHARMMIVGPRGHDGAALLGPVAHELLRRCACPTVFVHGTNAAERSPREPVPSADAPAR
jgi:nucleotide-binding universal stress UspA family protein